MVELSVAEWLRSTYLRRVASRVAYTYLLPPEDVPDLYQELCLALWKAGPDRMVNATWLFHTANHRAADILKRKRKHFEVSVTGMDGIARTSTADPELTLLVHSEVRRLPKSLRRFYRLRYEEGYTQRELVQHERLTRGSVRGMEKKCLRWMTRRNRLFF